jgi:transposase
MQQKRNNNVKAATGRRRSMSPTAVAKLYGVGIGKVLAWIKSGDLKAVNVATNRSQRPRWAISPDAIAEFERLRAPVTAGASSALLAPRRKARRSATVAVETFY